MTQKENGNTVISEELGEELKISLNPWAEFDTQPPTDGTTQNGTTPFIAIACGIGYANVDRMKQVFTKLQELHPGLVLISQGRYAPDQLALATAKQLGIMTKVVKPKFLVDGNIKRLLAGRQMSQAEQEMYGYSALTNEWAEKCIELHVFGAYAGPQNGWARAFQLAGKVVMDWDNPEHTAVRHERVLDEIPEAYTY